MENKPSQESQKKVLEILFKKEKKFIIFTISVLLLYLFGTIYFPGFKGRVLDKETGKPIKDAYLICFNDYYHFQINPGGANSETGTMQIAKSDEYGYFKVKPYFKLSFGWVPYRRIYIFKEGYIYAKEYFQYSNSKRHLKREAIIRGPIDKKFIFLKVNDFLLSKYNADTDYKGNQFPNRFLGVLWYSVDFHDYYKREDIRRYKQLKPFFMQLYKTVNTYSEEIKQTLKEHHLVHNWDWRLKNLRKGLEIKKTN